jgi:phage-related protein
MPMAQIILFKEKQGKVPLLEWLDSESNKIQLKSIAALKKLAIFGHQLRRPHADYLRDGVYELRLKDGRRNIRILYFFHGSNIVIVSHGLAKEDVVPAKEIDLAMARHVAFAKSPATHTYQVILDAIATEEDDHEDQDDQQIN